MGEGEAMNKIQVGVVLMMMRLVLKEVVRVRARDLKNPVME